MSSEAKVARIPNCDMCGHPANYDAKTRFGPWAYMCEPCWRAHGTGKLGTGFGQRLVVEDGE